MEALSSLNLSKEGGAATPAARFRCEACFKQFGAMSRLVEHIAKAGHSQHEPKCAHCKKHCKCFEALREHLLGPLCKKECSKAFSEKGCHYCLEFVDDQEMAAIHRLTCPWITTSTFSSTWAGQMLSTKRIRVPADVGGQYASFQSKGERLTAVSLDCEMVGGGDDGSINICARICVVDEGENVLLNTFVKPSHTVTDYRYDITHIEATDLENGMSFEEARRRVMVILQGAENRRKGKKGFSRLLVGHSLNHDLECLNLTYPSHLIRDTGCYPPLLRTSGVPHKLRDLARTYLGYQIQDEGRHEPYEDAVAAMRIYRWLRARAHTGACLPGPKEDIFHRWNRERLESLRPQALLEHSRPYYKCWCQDKRLLASEDSRCASKSQLRKWELPSSG